MVAVHHVRSRRQVENGSSDCGSDETRHRVSLEEIQHDAAASAGRFLVHDRRGGGVLQGRSGAIENDDLLARRAAGLHSDRKSTRLNSSHRCISYAVFCLKKKKNTTAQST